MTVQQIILQQLGGNQFVVITGVNHLIADGNTLRMTIPKNQSKANRLWITYDPGEDLYTMRFFKFTAGRFNRKTFTYSDDKEKEIETIQGLYCDQLAKIFEQVTGMYTKLF